MDHLEYNVEKCKRIVQKMAGILSFYSKKKIMWQGF